VRFEDHRHNPCLQRKKAQTSIPPAHVIKSCLVRNFKEHLQEHYRIIALKGSVSDGLLHEIF